MNAYTQLELIRDFIGEATAAHWSWVNLLRRLNMSQRKYERKVAMTNGDWLLKKATVTATASVITLPNDCAKPVYIENSSGIPLRWLQGGVSHRAVSKRVGTTLAEYESNELYPLAHTIEVNASNYSGSLSLWYQKRVPDLHCGYAYAGTGASTLVFDKSTAVDIASTDLGTGREIKLTDDYYNNSTVEVLDATSGIVDISSGISDYVGSTATATITGTPAANEIYATVSVLPEECHHLMVLDTTILALIKPGANLDKEALQYYRDELKGLTKEFDHWLESRIPSSMLFGVLEEY